MLQVFKLITCQQVLITVLHDKWSLSYQSDEESVRLYADQRETTPFGTYMIWFFGKLFNTKINFFMLIQKYRSIYVYEINLKNIQ